MVGVITSWDILVHPMATIRSFGWLVFFKAVVPWRRTPFLSLLRDAGFLKPSVPSLPTLLERCIGLELRAKWIYGVLAKALCNEGLVGPFFAGLAQSLFSDNNCRSLSYVSCGNVNVLSVAKSTNQHWNFQCSCSRTGRKHLEHHRNSVQSPCDLVPLPPPMGN
jgi:hypothetical protein